MDNPYNSNELKLQQAADFLRGGKKGEARQMLREVLVADQNNIPAWELLLHAANNIEEEKYCLGRILNLQPDHPSARQRLEALEADQAQPLLGGLPTLQGSTRSASASSTAPSGHQPAAPALASKKPGKKNNPNLLPWLLVIASVVMLGIMTFMLVHFTSPPLDTAARATRTAGALHSATCQEIIDRALQIAGSSCNQFDSNSVCYGNDTLLAELIPDLPLSFSERGDIVGIPALRRLSVSPINLDTEEWGIAIFKVMANLPRSLPGETVTMMVFGNTDLENQSQNLETFYFSSGLGEVICEQVPFDGILLSMPDGTGVSFVVNGAELTLMGNASLTAQENGELVISLYSGSAEVTSEGVTQVFGAGEQVSISLGGETGTEAVSAPSAPVPLSPEDLVLPCTMAGDYCNPADILPVNPDNILETLEAGQLTPTISLTPTITSTPTSTSTITQTPTITPFGFKTPTPTTTGTRTPTPTRTMVPSNTSLYPPTRTPTTSPPLTCPTAGSLTASTNSLLMPINNNSGTPAELDTILLYWVQPNRIDSMSLGGSTIINPNDSSSPTNIPSEKPWNGTSATRTIPANDAKLLVVNFQSTLLSGYYNITVTFKNGCQLPLRGVTVP